jgi:hypothetical protein
MRRGDCPCPFPTLSSFRMHYSRPPWWEVWPGHLEDVQNVFWRAQGGGHGERQSYSTDQPWSLHHHPCVPLARPGHVVGGSLGYQRPVGILAGGPCAPAVFASPCPGSPHPGSFEVDFISRGSEPPAGVAEKGRG